MKRSWLALFACLTSVAAGAASYRASQEAYADHARPVIRDVRSGLLEAMSPDERVGLKKIPIRVMPDRGIGAFATRINGEPRIIITTGMIFWIDQVATALVVATMHNREECAIAFFDRYGKAYLNNTKAASLRSGQELTRAPTALEFTKKSSKCIPTNVSDIQGTKWDTLRETIIHQSIGLVVAHEYGHHLDPSPRTREPAIQMQRELFADQFALSLATRAYGSPGPGMTAMMLMAAGEQFSFEGESTHPSGMRRLLILMEAALNVMIDDRKLLSSKKINQDNLKNYRDVLLSYHDKLLRGPLSKNDQENLRVALARWPANRIFSTPAVPSP